MFPHVPPYLGHQGRLGDLPGSKNGTGECDSPGRIPRTPSGQTPGGGGFLPSEPLAQNPKVP